MRLPFARVGTDAAEVPHARADAYPRVAARVPARLAARATSSRAPPSGRYWSAGARVLGHPRRRPRGRPLHAPSAARRLRDLRRLTPLRGGAGRGRGGALRGDRGQGRGGRRAPPPGPPPRAPGRRALRRVLPGQGRLDRGPHPRPGPEGVRRGRDLGDHPKAGPRGAGPRRRRALRGLLREAHRGRAGVAGGPLATALLALASVAALWLLRRFARRLPGPLVLLAASTVLVWLLGLDRAGVAVVGAAGTG